jgi:hypothetical protein
VSRVKDRPKDYNGALFIGSESHSHLSYRHSESISRGEVLIARKHGGGKSGNLNDTKNVRRNHASPRSPMIIKYFCLWRTIHVVATFTILYPLVLLSLYHPTANSVSLHPYTTEHSVSSLSLVRYASYQQEEQGRIAVGLVQLGLGRR